MQLKTPIHRIGIFLGGMRCGSTAMNDYLKQHPEVCVYKKKDPHFFSGDKEWANGWGSYLSGWESYEPERHKVAFESSTHYTKAPMYKDTAERMATSPFDMRLIYGVRPPLERIESHFVHNAGKAYYDPGNQEERSRLLQQAINVSNYSMQIERFERFFSSYQLLVMETGDLIKKPAETLRRVCEFLGADANLPFEPIPRRERKFKQDISNIKLTEEEVLLASRALYEPTKSFEEKYGLQLWDGVTP